MPSPTPTQSPSALHAEIHARLASGSRHLTVAGLDAAFRALGYRLDRSRDCRSVARYLTGPRAGETYPAISTGLKELDSGLSAFNVSARRDDRFRAMQVLRGEVFAVTQGAILEV